MGILSLLQPSTDVYFMLKANAYGHGIENVIRALDGVKTTCWVVDTFAEAEAARAVDATTPLLVTRVLDLADLRQARRIRARAGIHDLSLLQQWSQMTGDNRPEIDLFVDVGMQRGDISANEVDDVMSILGNLGIDQLAGVHGHIVNWASPHAQSQMDSFGLFAERVKSELGAQVKCVVASSRSVFSDHRFEFDGVRIGRALYGMTVGIDADEVRERISPAIAIEAMVEKVQPIAQSLPIGYAALHPAEIPDTSHLVCLRIGFADIPTMAQFGKDRKFVSNGTLYRIIDVGMHITVAVTNGEVAEVGSWLSVFDGTSAEGAGLWTEWTGKVAPQHIAMSLQQTSVSHYLA